MFVISCGNHWLQADENLVHQEFVSDLCKATLHTKEFAEKYVADARERNKIMEFLKFQKALERERNRVKEALKSTWIRAFESLVRLELGDKISSDGIWTNAHMFYGQGLSLKDAVVSLKKSFRIK
jgi:hypothetical protein